MKTYYDLKDSELKDYKKEFRKTEQGKKMNIVKILIYTIYVLIIAVEMSIVWNSNGSTIDTDYLFAGLDRVGTFALIAAVIYEVYYNISFTFWLKNKHQINRW